MTISIVEFCDLVIGLPYDPVKLNCWHIVARCQKQVFDRDLPPVIIRPDNMRELVGMMELRKTYQGWQEVPEPQHGAVVFMTKNGHDVSNAACHVGVWLDFEGGGVLHTDDPQGVAFESLTVLKNRNWGDFAFHVPVTAE